MTTVYLLRHAAYESPDHILPYRLPGFPLSEEGKSTAEKLAEEFSKKNIAAIYSSPLLRTRQTAELIAKKVGKEVIYDDRLLEVRSPVQGKPEGFPESLGGWKIYESDWYKNLHGERPEEVFARMVDFMKEKVSEHAGKEIIVVSHGDPIMFYVGGNKGLGLLSDEIRALDYVQMGHFLTLAFPS